MEQMKDKIRTVTFLGRKQIDFLDNLGKDALFYRGYKLSRAQILAELVNVLIELKIDVKKIDLSDGSLAKALLKILGNGKTDDTQNNPI